MQKLKDLFSLFLVGAGGVIAFLFARRYWELKENEKKNAIRDYRDGIADLHQHNNSTPLESLVNRENTRFGNSSDSETPDGKGDRS